MKKKREPSIVPGNDDALLKDASKEDKKKGNVTKVTSVGVDS